MTRYTRYEFERRRHSAVKVAPYFLAWEGTVILTTTQPIEDEVDAERDLEALVSGGQLNLFGKTHRLSSVNFDWAPDQTAKASYGEITCLVTIGYRAELIGVSQSERDQRRAIMSGTGS